MGYLGSKFRKCDLQMQTPADSAHWMGENFDVVDDPVSAAEAYIDRCYQVGLEVIAITDHNFYSKKFIPYLKDAAETLSKNYNYKLTIFPGFEFTANVGKGLHVLGIFAPNRDLDQIDHILTKCGVPLPRQNSSGAHIPSTHNLVEIIEAIQTKNEAGELEGIVVLPHSQSDSGLFDNNKIANWLQAAEFVNPNLYALEVPKSPSLMSAGWRKLLENGADCNEEWKRVRPVACVLSSDTKSISDRTNTTHTIGSKYTWMKMGEPSLEALRQCFLDSASRLRLSDTCSDNPEGSYAFPRILSLDIKNTAFLENQRIDFSPNLNTFIGGRGTGKSTVLEYLRMVLQRAHEIDTEESGELQKDFAKFKATLNPESVLVVEYDKGMDFEDTFKITFKNGSWNVAGEDVGSIQTFFPVQIFSRSQIEAMANDPAKQRKILDAPILPVLSILSGREREAVAKVKALNSKIAAAEELEKERGTLVSNIRNLGGQIDSIHKHLGPLKEWLEWKSAKSKLDAVDLSLVEALTALENHILKDGYSFPTDALETDAVTAVNDEIKKVSDLANGFRNSITEKIEAAKSKLSQIQKAPARLKWVAAYEVVKSAQADAVQELTGNGIDPNEYERLIILRGVQKDRLKKVEGICQEIAEGRTIVEEILTQELQPIWNEEICQRKEIAKQFNANVPKTESGQPTVKTVIIPYGDFMDFRGHMQQYLSDKRSISETDWEVVMRAIFDEATTKNLPPSFVLRDWLDLSKQNTKIPGFPIDKVNLSKMAVIASWITETALNDILVERTLDSVSVSLHRRADGKLVGDLAGRKLSAGQKATTILCLILACGDDPIVIDQPEDDLDNEFVYDQLVPMLRDAKERRQVILATHNANIPVNGDAELIIPLEISGERGAQKRVGDELAVGSLDKKLVQGAVELILEGSVEAFKRRQDRYGI